MRSPGVRLSRLLVEAPARAVGSERDGVDRSDFAVRVAALADALARAGSGRWLVCTDDSFLAGVALFALARAGSTGVLPPNRQPETLARLRADVCGAVADDEGVRRALEGLPLLDPSRARPARGGAGGKAAARLPDPAHPFVELHTSGTTGDAKRFPKTLEPLEREVATLERLFGERVGPDARILASVSHQHVYGLLFRVLWPLATGRPFQANSLLHPEELLARMRRGPCALVTTPTSLRRLVAGGRLRAARGTCRAVFSSGGPLPAETAKAVTELLGEAPFEILGSTETGGIAVRQRSLHGESWHPFPEVAVERDAEGCLVVTSPFASEGFPAGPARRRFATRDRVELEPGGTFLLRGRADRTVKIGEKRLPLPSMEADLARHAFVDEASLVVRESGGDARVHAAVALSAPGRETLAAAGRRAVTSALGAHLEPRWDPVLRPRAWRLLDALPRDAQGKLPRGAVEGLFDAPPGAPLVLDERRGPDWIERRCEVPIDLSFLDGHFPGRPLVPGVAQLHWALDAATRVLGGSPRVRALEALKFPVPLGPGDRFALRVEISAARDRATLRLADGERVFATGRAILEPGAGDPSGPGEP